MWLFCLTPWWNVLAHSELCIHFPFLNLSSPYLTFVTTLKQLTALLLFPCSFSLFLVVPVAFPWRECSSSFFSLFLWDCDGPLLVLSSIWYFWAVQSALVISSVAVGKLCFAPCHLYCLFALPPLGWNMAKITFPVISIHKIPQVQSLFILFLLSLLRALTSH